MTHAGLVILSPHASQGHVTHEIHHARCCYCVKMAREAGRLSGGVREREPLSSYARLIRGERSAPNYVCLTPALPGNCALWRKMRRQRVHIFHSMAITEALGTGRILLFLCIFPPFQSVFPPTLLLSPLSMSCIITSRYKDRADRAQHREARG